MNPEIKQRWLDALRSGKYQQGTGYLKDGDKFCCLGVLCDIVKDEVDGEWDCHDYFNINELYEGNSILPHPVCHHVGLTDQSPMSSLTRENEFLAFSHLNDHGWTFEQIADQIEKDL